MVLLQTGSVVDEHAPSPRVKLTIERLLQRTGDRWSGRFVETDTPVIQLSFRYGDVLIDADDARQRFFLASAGSLQPVERNRDVEVSARRVIESFGAVELDCVDHLDRGFDGRASYLLRETGDAHDYCSFAAYALPQLRALGWEVDVDEGYPYAVLDSDAPWYASIDDERPDWFSLELGVMVEGRQLSLLPALVGLLQRCPDDTTLQALLRRPLEFFALPTGDGRYVPVSAKRLRRVLTVLRELYDGPSGELRCPSTRAASLTRLDGVVKQWHGGSRIRSRARDLRCVPPVAEVPPQLNATLRDYQRHGVAWLQHLRVLEVGGVLADDMGLGKTLQAVAHLLMEKCAGRRGTPSLVVAPTSLVLGWQREIQRFAPALRTVLYHGSKRRSRVASFDRADVVITSYPLVARDQELFAARRFHVLVLDEAQTIKNRRSQAYRAVAAIGAAQTVALTGTPIENRLEELYALMSLLVPGLLGHSDGFRSGFVKPIEQGDDTRLEVLRQRVAPYLLRRLKSDVAPELPPKTCIVRAVELRGAQRELYESIRVAAHTEVRELIRSKGLAASTVPVLSALMKLRQVCCDPRLINVEAAQRTMRSAKLETLLDMLRHGVAAGRRTLVFSQFTSMLALIAHELQREQMRYVVLTGSTRDRQRQVDAFQAGDAEVFLISLKAGGTGLTLTEADTVIHYDPWYNPAVQAQATDRAHRIGQHKPVFVYDLIAAGSVEERMLQLQRRKRQLADAILGTGFARALDLAEVEDLFAPLANNAQLADGAPLADGC